MRSKEDFDIAGSLPKKNIDTGMGLERVAFMTQGVENMYEIDVMFPVIQRADGALAAGATAPTTRTTCGSASSPTTSAASMMLIGDGVTPGNEGRGYVLRRLLRRAVRSMRLLGYDDPALPELMPISRDKMGETYTDLTRDWDRIARVAYGEEETFRKTLQAGTQIFDLAAGDVKKAGGSTLSGEQAFALHDTYGFPIDLTLEMAAEQGLVVDEQGFRALMAEQRERAKADARAKKGQHADTSALPRHPRRARPHRVAGLRDARDRVPRRWRCSAAAAPCRSLAQGEIGELVLDRTPFYAESGGQAADAGTIDFDGGRLEVLDVQRPIKGLVVHQVRVARGRAAPPTRTLHAQRRPRAGASAPARRTPAPTSCTPRCARCSARPRCSPAPTTGPATCASTSAGPRRCSPEQVREIEQVSQQALRADLPVGWQYMTPRAGQGVGRDRALRRDLRQHQGARRRDRRPVVARALRRHPRRPLVADRHRRGDRRGERRVRQPPDRGAHRRRGLRLPGPRARRRRPS